MSTMTNFKYNHKVDIQSKFCGIKRMDIGQKVNVLKISSFGIYYKMFCNIELILAYINGFIITWILHQIYMFSNKVKLLAG